MKPVEAEIVTESIVVNTEFTPNISFADISLGSEKEKEKEKENNTKLGTHTKQFEVRPRSVSCAASLYCNHIEKAFLVNSPRSGYNMVHNSCRMQAFSNSTEVKRYTLQTSAVNSHTKQG